MSFFDGGNKSISFGERGDNTMRGTWQGGVIVNISEPVTSMSYVDKSKPKTFKDGTEVMKLIVTLDTKSGKCPAPPLDAEDNGVRDLHVDKGSGQSRSISRTLRAAKLGDIQVGGSLYIRWTTGEGAIGNPRVFETIIEPPAQGSGGMFTEPEQPSFPGQVVPTAAPSFPAQVPGAQPTSTPNPYGPGIAAPKFDPNTGRPLAPPAPAPRFDPNTGQPISAAVGPGSPAQTRFDPATGQPITNPYAG